VAPLLSNSRFVYYFLDKNSCSDSYAGL